MLFFPIVDNVPVLPLLGLWLLAQLLSGLASIATTGASARWAHLGGFARGLLLAPLLWPGTPSERTEDVERC